MKKPIELANDDILLLCTDGLCGMIRDTEIESILKNSDGNLTNTADALVSAAINASGADNVTLCLLNGVSGFRKASAHIPQIANRRSTQFHLILVSVIVIIIAAVLWIWNSNLKSQTMDNSSNSDDIVRDSIATNIISDSIGGTTIDSVTADSPVNNPIDTETPSENDLGNGKILLQGLKTGQIPKTEEKRLSEEEREAEILSTPEIIVVTLPPNKHIGTFCKEFGMTKTEFEKLNPEIKFEEVKAGDQINVYKKINKNDK